MWYPFKKSKKNITISEESKKRIEEESNRVGKPQILFLKVYRDQTGIGNVMVTFTDKAELKHEFVSFENQTCETLLSLGELRFEFGKFYFYPNVDLEWKKSPRSEIHQLVSNYIFSEKPLYLESENFSKLRPILRNCFQKEGVVSAYFQKNLCQLEIPNLTKEKEERISEEILTYLSSLYESPWEG
ncbi:hypothetical protein EHQ16_16045 [Leptospira kanakyensis]|uniref:Uncharacterized protein n=1 Tax=Leptospira kanakyensis TaxID=2484968 RepID=A0A6N4Q3L7_9LEPT|nr:hypothetical protein [Leptospira kanakyensis]TGK53581.1 hypothetical protein EHQ11_04355 [Leptospira kanakyensis]TGK57376.1 hypothetical protein EHQ16_16045 [Leptospira kanakyensis]TGK73087.1 hypothetical protein EHQ18_04430 [Leptospira kanakyensis]